MRARILGLLALAVSAWGWADGGSLEFRLTGLERESFQWSLDSGGLTSRRRASLVLDKGAAEAVSVFEALPARLFVSMRKPLRLFSDLNGDGVCDSGELFSESSGNRYTTRFDNVKIPARLLYGDRPVILVDFEHLSFGAGYLNVVRVESCYEGSVTLEGRKYAARAVFRSPLTANREDNPAIILDADGDGKFNHFTDPWFSSSGIAFLHDSLWMTDTIFSGTSASVALRPYEGPTGRLRVEGQGVHRFYLQVQRSRALGSPVRCDRYLCLPAREDGVYLLPEGSYMLKNLWLLDAGEEEPTYFRWNARSAGPSLMGLSSISKDSTQEVHLGGPLSTGIDVDSSNLIGRLGLDYRGLRNSSGLEFEPIFSPETEGEWRPAAPRFEIRNREGAAVASDKFEYG